jgi:hypothetical protein
MKISPLALLTILSGYFNTVAGSIDEESARRQLNGKKAGADGKKGGMEMSMPDECPPPPPPPIPDVLYEQSYGIPPSANGLTTAQRTIAYYASGWCGNNAGDDFCLFDGGGEGDLGNAPRPGDTNSAFAFTSQNSVSAALFTFTNPNLVGPFSTDDVTTLAWKQTNGGDEARNALRVGLLVQLASGGNLMWYVSESTYFNPTTSGPDGMWVDFNIDLQGEMYYVVDHGAAAPGDVTLPELPIRSLTANKVLPAGASIVSLGFVWPNGGNSPAATTRNGTVRWDDVVLSSV